MNADRDGESSGTAMEKGERFDRVAAAVAAILLDGGLDALRYARVSRESGVSRAWLYKYFGKGHDALLDFAARSFGAAFADLDVPRRAADVRAWREQIRAGTRKGLRDTLATPWIVEFWFRFRHSPNALGHAIRDVEARHVAKFVHEMPAELSRRGAVAKRFARVFTATRFGAYFSWLDPRLRKSMRVDEFVAEILRPIDAFLDEAEHSRR